MRIQIGSLCRQIINREGPLGEGGEIRNKYRQTAPPHSLRPHSIIERRRPENPPQTRRVCSFLVPPGPNMNGRAVCAEVREGN